MSAHPALSQALPSTGMFSVLSGLLTSTHRPLWVGTGCSPPSRSGMVSVSFNGFTRLTSCFIILLYYKHILNIKALFLLGWLYVLAERIVVLLCGDAHQGWGLHCLHCWNFISSFWVAGRGWAEVLVYDNSCSLIRRKTGNLNLSASSQCYSSSGG